MTIYEQTIRYFYVNDSVLVKSFVWTAWPPSQSLIQLLPSCSEVGALERSKHIPGIWPYRAQVFG